MINLLCSISGNTAKTAIINKVLNSNLSPPVPSSSYKLSPDVEIMLPLNRINKLGKTNFPKCIQFTHYKAVTVRKY